MNTIIKSNSRVSKITLIATAAFLVSGFFFFSSVANAAPVAGDITYTIKHYAPSITTDAPAIIYPGAGDGTYNIIYDSGKVRETDSLQNLSIIVTGTDPVTMNSVSLNNSPFVSPSFLDFQYNSGTHTWSTQIAANTQFKDSGYYTFGPNTLVAKFSDANSSTTIALKTNVILNNVLPTIALIGDSTINLTVGNTFVDQGATSTDAVGNPITPVVSGTVTTSTIGTYTVTYTATDSLGNIASTTRTVVVGAAPDTTPPVITLIGSANMNVGINTTFTDPGFTAIDNIDGNITASTTVTITPNGTVDTSTLGVYTITYSVSDKAGNTATSTRTVNVVESVPVAGTLSYVTAQTGGPHTLTASSSVYNAGKARSTDSLSELDLSVTGFADTPSIVSSTLNGVAGTIDFQYSSSTQKWVTTSAAGHLFSNSPYQPGENTLAVTFSDGISSLMLTLNVNIVPGNTLPTIILNGSNTMNITVGDNFIDPGATAVDAIGVDLTSSIVASGTVATSTLGTYPVTYTATDSLGHIATSTRTVNVKLEADNTPPAVGALTYTTYDSTTGETVTKTIASPTNGVYDAGIVYQTNSLQDLKIVVTDAHLDTTTVKNISLNGVSYGNSTSTWTYDSGTHEWSTQLGKDHPFSDSPYKLDENILTSTFSDLTGNETTITLKVFIKALDTTQQYASTSTETVGLGTSEIVVGQGSSNLSRIIVPNTVTSSIKLNLETLQDAVTHNVTVANDITLVKESTSTYTAVIPSGTVISGGSSWDGKISLPILKSITDYTAPSGNADVVVDMGSTVSLSFDKPVKVVIGGMSGKHAAWIQGTGSMTDITTVCDNVAAPTNISPTGPKECYANDGSDLVIWTYHFTSFAAYTPAVAQVVSGGGGSYYAPIVATSTSISTTSSIATSTTLVGQVLGASTFNFTQNLGLGSQGDDVTELQNRLTKDGVYSGPITGYFGPLTLAAVKTYQSKVGVFVTGFVGSLTRAQLNGSQVAGVSTVSDVVKAQIVAIQSQLITLLQQILQILQAQVNRYK